MYFTATRPVGVRRTACAPALRSLDRVLDQTLTAPWAANPPSRATICRATDDGMCIRAMATTRGDSPLKPADSVMTVKASFHIQALAGIAVLVNIAGSVIASGRSPGRPGGADAPGWPSGPCRCPGGRSGFAPRGS